MPKVGMALGTHETVGETIAIGTFILYFGAAGWRIMEISYKENTMEQWFLKAVSF